MGKYIVKVIKEDDIPCFKCYLNDLCKGTKQEFHSTKQSLNELKKLTTECKSLHNQYINYEEK